MSDLAKAIYAEQSYFLSRIELGSGYPAPDADSLALRSAVIQAAQQEWGEVWCGSFGRLDDPAAGAVLWLYETEQIDFDFIVPTYSDALERSIRHYCQEQKKLSEALPAARRVFLAQLHADGAITF